jgi:phage regulator Rha-like protein
VILTHCKRCGILTKFIGGNEMEEKIDSRTIAHYSGKDHNEVTRQIANMIEGIESDIEGLYDEPTNEIYYLMPKKEANELLQSYLETNKRDLGMMEKLIMRINGVVESV